MEISDKLFENLSFKSNTELFCFFVMLLEHETDLSVKNLTSFIKELFSRLWYVEEQKRIIEELYARQHF